MADEALAGGNTTREVVRVGDTVRRTRGARARDSCRPGTRIEDLGYMAWTWCVQSLGSVPIVDQARHLRELRNGYGEIEPESLVDAIVTRQAQIATAESANVDDPALTPARRRHARAALAWAIRDRELVRRHRDVLLDALR